MLRKHRSDRINEVTIPEMVKKIHKMVFDNRGRKARELTDKVGISKSVVKLLTD